MKYILFGLLGAIGFTVVGFWFMPLVLSSDFYMLGFALQALIASFWCWFIWWSIFKVLKATEILDLLNRKKIKSTFSEALDLSQYSYDRIDYAISIYLESPETFGCVDSKKLVAHIFPIIKGI